MRECIRGNIQGDVIMPFYAVTFRYGTYKIMRLIFSAKDENEALETFKQMGIKCKIYDIEKVKYD